MSTVRGVSSGVVDDGDVVEGDDVVCIVIVVVLVGVVILESFFTAVS